MIEIKLNINKYVEEQGFEIFKMLDKHKKIALLSNMKTGKSAFTIGPLKNYCMNKGYKLIFIIPTIQQIEQFRKRHNLSAQYSNSNSKNSDGFVITTPDSLPKVIKQCEEIHIKFMLVVDEAHEVESSYNFRPNFKNIETAINHKLCANVFQMSATLDNIILSQKENFDCILDIEVKNKFLNANKFEIVKVENHNNAKNIATFLKEIGKQYNQVIYKVDNIKTLTEVTKLLENSATLSNNEKTIFLSSRNREDNIISENITDDIELPTNLKFIGFTSLANSGIEISTGDKVAVVNVCTNSFNFINEIQFVGRFRNGAESYYLVIEIPKENKNLLSYETVKEELTEMAKSSLNSSNSLYKKYKHYYGVYEIRNELKHSYPFIFFNEELDMYSIDKILLNDFIFENYIKQFLNYPNKLKEKFENHKSFFAKEFKISEFNVEDITIANLFNEMQNEKRTLKKEEKQALKESLNYLSNLDDTEIHRMLNDLWDVEFISSEIKEHYEVWKELGQDIRKTIKELMYYIPNLEEVQAFKLAITKSKKDIENIFDSFQAITLNKIYDIDPNDLIEKKKKSLKMKLKITRDFMISNEYEKNGQRITNKLLNKLAEYHIGYGIMKEEKAFDKEKKLTKATINTLESLIQIIYKCNVNNGNIFISSVRKSIDDIIKIKKTLKRDTENISIGTTNKH